MLARLTYNRIGTLTQDGQQVCRCRVELRESLEHRQLLELQRDLYQQLTHSRVDFKSDQAARQLSYAVSSLQQPLLLLFDDIWDDEHLKALLPMGQWPNGSCIIATTRLLPATALLGDVAKVQDYSPGLLSKLDGRRLFQQILRAPKAPTGQQPPDVQADEAALGEIADQCDCLPLLLRVTASTLRLHPSWWRRAAGDLQGQTPMSGSKRDPEDPDDWLRRLQRSFDQLYYPDLQQAFLDVAMIWRGLLWQSAADDLGGDTLQQLMDHSLISLTVKNHAWVCDSLQMPCNAMPTFTWTGSIAMVCRRRAGLEWNCMTPCMLWPSILSRRSASGVYMFAAHAAQTWSSR